MQQRNLRPWHRQAMQPALPRAAIQKTKAMESTAMHQIFVGNQQMGSLVREVVTEQQMKSP